MKIKIEIKHFVTGSILFEFEKENNKVIVVKLFAKKQNY